MGRLLTSAGTAAGYQGLPGPSRGYQHLLGMFASLKRCMVTLGKSEVGKQKSEPVAALEGYIVTKLHGYIVHGANQVHGSQSGQLS